MKTKLLGVIAQEIMQHVPQKAEVVYVPILQMRQQRQLACPDYQSY